MKKSRRLPPKRLTKRADLEKGKRNGGLFPVKETTLIGKNKHQKVKYKPAKDQQYPMQLKISM